MKKGFTLVELLGVITILAVLGLMIVPSIQKNIREGKETAYNTQISKIKSAASDWVLKNSDSLPEKNGEMVTITLGDLKRGGFLPTNIKNTKTDELFLNSMVITITKNNYDYIIDVDVESGTTSDEIDMNSPIIILNGSYLEYVEIDKIGSSIYNEPGFIAKTSNGDIIDSSLVEITTKKDNNEQEIDVKNFGTYTITYSVTDNGLTTTAIRTVIVRDTTPPEITVPDNLVVDLSNIDSIDFINGVTASDNSGKIYSSSDIVVDYPEISKAGKYIITYSAIDDNGNKAEKRRILEVLD